MLLKSGLDGQHFVNCAEALSLPSRVQMFVIFLAGIDEKTPLLRSMDAVKREGLRLLKASGLGKDVETIYSALAMPLAMVL